MDKETTATQEAPAPTGGEATQAAAPAEQTAAPAPPANAASNAAAPASATVPAPDAAPAVGGETGVEVRPAEFPQADPGLTSAPGGQVDDILLGTMMPVAASLGQVKMPVRQLLQLGLGSVVKLDRQVGAPIDLFLRGIKFATGHLVVVGENLGVRINEILPVDATQEAASME